ncbi:MAG: hypothetical protein ABR521_00105 [Gaiellaceae bacterium]
MSDDLRRALRSEPIAGEHEARERAWAVVAASFDGRERLPWPRRHPRALLAAAAALAVLAGTLTPPGLALLDSARDAVLPERVVRRPALLSLPAAGRLLVNSAQGPWIVQADGSKRLLGRYEQASWSPHGLFVVVSRRLELLALDPKGNVRWSLTKEETPAQARWSPDGFRIAYRLGPAIRVVAGDGAGDRLLLRGAGEATPEWRPGPRHELALVQGGRVLLVDADSGRRLWQAAAPEPQELLWSADGQRLAVLSSASLSVFSGDGRLLAVVPELRSATAGGFAPGGHELALVRVQAGGGNEILIFDVDEPGTRRRILEASARFGDLEWSPDGRWLLVAREDADQ